MVVIENPGRKGMVFNFPNALKAARGRYVFLADQDDIWEPEKTATLLSMLAHYDLVVSDCSLIDENNLSPPVVNNSFSLYEKLRMRAHIFLPLVRIWMEKNSVPD